MSLEDTKSNKTCFANSFGSMYFCSFNNGYGDFNIF